MELIPAIDLLDGRCVRLHRGDFKTARFYPHDPVELAAQFEDAGIRRLHMVDLDGARTGVLHNLAVAGKVCAGTGLKVDFGGGIRSKADLYRIFAVGVSMVSIGSLALTQAEDLTDWIGEFGPDRFFLGADVKGDHLVYRGWQADSGVGWPEFIGKWTGLGIMNFFSTSVERDGDLTGPDLALYERIRAQFQDISLVASGGVSGWDDLEQLSRIGMTGAIIGKAFYEGKITLNEIGERNGYVG